jgi:transcriptional regulator with XRE-family HTH domain
VIKIYNEPFIKAFGKHLKQLRDEQKISQRKLGEKANIDFNQIGRIERGQQNTTLSTIYALSKALEVPHGLLFKFAFEEKK